MRENLVSRLILAKKTLIYLIGTKEEKKTPGKPIRKVLFMVDYFP